MAFPNSTREASGSPTIHSCCASTPTTNRSTSSLPAEEFGAAWEPVIYTASETDEDAGTHDAGGKVTVAARAVMVLRAATE